MSNETPSNFFSPTRECPEHGDACVGEECCCKDKHLVSVETSKPADLLTRREGLCDDCRREYPTPWFAPNEIWNAVVKEAAVLCPSCFIARAQSAGMANESWCLDTEKFAHISEVERLQKERDAAQEEAAGLTGYKLAIAEAHATLDKAGVPSATGVACDDPRCNSKVGHRIHILGARAEAAESKLSQLQLELRQRLWMGHGHTLLYGDDGEMECNECRLSDYKRGDLDELRQQAVVMRIKTLESQKLANEEKARKIVDTIFPGLTNNIGKQFDKYVRQVLAILNGGQS